MTQRKLIDAGYAAAQAGKPCIAPTTKERDRAAWEQGWRAARLDRFSGRNDKKVNPILKTDSVKVQHTAVYEDVIGDRQEKAALEQTRRDEDTIHKWLRKQENETFDRMRKEATELRAFLEPCRPDMHEPDEQGVAATVIGTHLDNAFGNGINQDAIDGGYQEFVIVLTKQVEEIQKGKSRQVTKTLAVNLANLIALARKAFEGDNE